MAEVKHKVVKRMSRAFSGGLEEVLAVDDKFRLGWFELLTAWYDSGSRCTIVISVKNEIIFVSHNQPPCLRGCRMMIAVSHVSSLSSGSLITSPL
jgi:hypothetical protein